MNTQSISEQINFVSGNEALPLVAVAVIFLMLALNFANRK